MKKLFLILFLALAVITASAQTEHMKFLGIPIDGTISSFTSNLHVKGFYFDRESNKETPADMRVLKGTFHSRLVKVAVFFDSKTSTVYEVKVMFDSYDADDLKSLRAELETAISSKYLNQTDTTYDKDGNPITNIYVYPNEGQFVKQAHIQLWIDEFVDVYRVLVLWPDVFEETYRTSYRLNLAYIDSENYNKYIVSQIEEL